MQCLGSFLTLTAQLKKFLKGSKNSEGTGRWSVAWSHRPKTEKQVRESCRELVGRDGEGWKEKDESGREVPRVGEG